jgi:hypothetical protein
MNPNSQPQKVIWIDDPGGGKFPACPTCKEPAYFADKCCFCGQAFEQDDEKLREFDHSVQIERDGYTIIQASNYHVHIYDPDGRTISHIACTRKLTEKDLEEQLEFVKEFREER